MIYYLGAYRSKYIMSRNPQGSDAQDTKMSYIIKAIKSLKKPICVVSTLASLNCGFHAREKHIIDELETHIYLESWDEVKRPFCTIGAIFRLISLFFFLLFHAQKEDTVIVYNTQLYSVPVRLAKFLKHFRMILEVEELFYTDVRNPADVKRKGLELKLISAADAYITASALLKEEISKGRDCVVLYGAYDIPPLYCERQNDGYIHVVYAGSIDTLRRVDLAVESFRYLPQNYKLHILGSGDQSMIKSLKSQISIINNLAGFQKVEYIGCLHGKEFDEFLQSCHIGLNMQDIGTSMEKYGFPSKISSYFARGLNVVSGKLESIVSSPFVHKVAFFELIDPQIIAKAIMNADVNHGEIQINFIINQEQQFINELKKII